MSTQSQSSHFVEMSRSGKVNNPLDLAMTNAMKRYGSPLFNGALKRLGPCTRNMALQLSAPNATREDKILALARVTTTHPHCSISRGVSSVLAFAVLTRLDECFQRELEARGYRRAYRNATEMDLLEAMHLVWKTGDDDRLVSLVASEVACFLGFVERFDDLEVAIRSQLGQFKELASEGAFATGIC